MSKKLKNSKVKDRTDNEKRVLIAWESKRKGSKFSRPKFKTKYPAGRKKNHGSCRKGKQTFFPTE